MVQAYRHLRPMAWLYMVMEPAMVCLMAAGAIHGFAEASALDEVSVGAGAEAGIGAGLVGGGEPD